MAMTGFRARRGRRAAGWWALALSLLLFLPASCSRKPSVVVYVSVDQPYAEPVLRAFGERAGIEVLPVFDVEATKTTGLVNRLLAEKGSPRGDVFWSSEVAQTVWLRERGILAPYRPSSAEDVPDRFRDPEGHWTGVGLRARVFLVNTLLVPDGSAPSSYLDLEDPSWFRQGFGFSNPLFGTAATQVAAFYSALGPERTRDYLVRIRENGIQILDGNSTVRDQVASGRLAMGLVDTDDAEAAARDGGSVRTVFPGPESRGTLYFPGSVALVAGGPHPEWGRRLVDHLASAEAERALIEARFFHASVRTPPEGMDVQWSTLAPFLDLAKADCKEIFLR